jgi:hypothetical protein
MQKRQYFEATTMQPHYHRAFAFPLFRVHTSFSFLNRLKYHIVLFINGAIYCRLVPVGTTFAASNTHQPKNG